MQKRFLCFSFFFFSFFFFFFFLFFFLFFFFFWITHYSHSKQGQVKRPIGHHFEPTFLYGILCNLAGVNGNIVLLHKNTAPTFDTVFIFGKQTLLSTNWHVIHHLMLCVPRGKSSISIIFFHSKHLIYNLLARLFGPW